MKISEAINYKRQIRTSCNLDVKMLDTTEDGIVLVVEKKLVNADAFELITGFVNQNKLSLLSESGQYFISINNLIPAAQQFY